MNDTTWFWQIVDARGLANVSSDEFVALNELISAAERAESELNAVSAAIGSPRFMDPPDGGDVPLAEQVRRMRERLELLEKTARDVEAWWLEDGHYAFNGCPHGIFAIRAALDSGRHVSAEFKRCDDCGGSGLALNARGEPDECRACRGNTVTPLAGSGRNLADAP